MPTDLVKILSIKDSEFITVLFIFVVLAWCKEIGKNSVLIPEGSLDSQNWNKISHEFSTPKFSYFIYGGTCRGQRSHWAYAESTCIF